MSKPQFVLEEALEAYLGRLASPYIDRDKTIDSIVDARVYGKLGRVCKSCIDKYCRFLFKEFCLKRRQPGILKLLKTQPAIVYFAGT